jgi:plasmid stability protein
VKDLLVRDVDDATWERLRDRADRNGRSLNSELKLILDRAAQAVDMKTAREQAEEISRRLAGRHHSDSAALLREDRDR